MKLSGALKLIRVLISIYAVMSGITAAVILIALFAGTLPALAETSRGFLGDFFYDHYLEWIALDSTRLFTGFVFITSLLTVIFYWKLGKVIENFSSLDQISSQTFKALINCVLIWVAVLGMNFLCNKVVGYNQQAWTQSTKTDSEKISHRIEFEAIQSFANKKRSTSEANIYSRAINEADADPAMTLKLSESRAFSFGTDNCGGFLSLLFVAGLLFLCRHLLERKQESQAERVMIDEARLTI